MNNSREQTGKEGNRDELYAACDSERNSLIDWYEDHSHVELHDEGINTLCKICPPEEYGEDEDCESLQNIIRVMYYRISELESQIQDLEPKFTELEMECKRLKAELKRKDEALGKIVKSDWTDEGCFGLNSAQLHNRSIKIAEQALKPKTDEK